MFQRLRGYRFLKMRTDSNGVLVGFDGVAAHIARVHQFGQCDQIGPGTFAKYPVRELLGLSAADLQAIEHAAINSLGSAVP
ncbi:phage virion morphogenesis protein [Candidatus Symbiopectobacterium sp. 'North America']|nr:phage virion morphogenesis protein [Candidatus Symbiopectobacterium sp. 'North America']